MIGWPGEQGPAGASGAPGIAGANGAAFTPFDRTNSTPSSIFVGSWPPGSSTLPAGYLRYDRFIVAIGVGIPKQWRAISYQAVAAFPGSPIAQINPQIVGSAANSQAPEFDHWTGLASVTWAALYSTVDGQPRVKYELTITTSKDPNEVTFACYGEQGTELVQL